MRYGGTDMAISSKKHRSSRSVRMVCHLPCIIEVVEEKTHIYTLLVIPPFGPGPYFPTSLLI